ncbi:cytochrome P450 [Nocardia jinanensis]|uniref:Cytochrome P450 n=1 Tax=Nocardia jinanensis TaxID=382504 RepID=A0A917RGT1_9NOCA|nr:cytochrome P450 [Nocardia jinanensis]GGL07362.1 cytochrome P450 [Nocardia jinanensis]
MPLFAPEFAADPHAHYREMRKQNQSLMPVELAPGVPATLVIDYRTAVRILNDPEHFPADPRTWQKDMPADCPILPLLEWRPMATRSAGAEATRYRQATTESVGTVDLYALHATVEEIAVSLINSFCEEGSADLISQYTFPLIFGVLNVLFGCPPELGQKMAAGMASVVEGVDADQGNLMMSEAMLELVALKRAEPGDDITSALLRHPADLDDLEMVHQVACQYGAGIEFQQNFIVNTLLFILTDDRLGGGVLGGSLSTREALDDVLFNDPPLANYLLTYPRQPILIDDAWLPAHQPIVVSIAACNNDPAVRSSDRTGNRSHLGWGAGPRTCPAQSMAYLIAQDAIDQLLDALPEIQLAEAPTWRPGPFHRSLASLRVEFPVSSPLHIS